jgi:16S rRNA (adenine1518-N6/adenine1519-N6)-dimethyltransferase
MAGKLKVRPAERGDMPVDKPTSRGRRRPASDGQNRSQSRGGKTEQGFPTPDELDRLTPRALLQRLGLRAHKGLSQSFLVDRYVVQEIVEAAEISPEDEVLEIGPGLGILTRALVSSARRVVAVELDRVLADLLPALVQARDRLEVIQADALDVEPSTVFKGHYKVAANLPYSVTSPMLRHMLTATSKPDVMVVMVQKEVADRIAAKPGDTSLLSIMVQLYARVSVVVQVPASAFYPPPKVDSTVLRLDIYGDSPVEVDDPEALLKLVASGFSRRRKQLHNALSEALWFPPGEVSRVLESAGIDPMRRAQTLTLEEWALLHRTYGTARAQWQKGVPE